MYHGSDDLVFYVHRISIQYHVLPFKRTALNMGFKHDIYWNAVLEFHEKFGSTIGNTSRPDLNDPELMDLRFRLIDEELTELIESRKEMPRGEKFVKELCDLLYVLYGFGIAFGIKLDGTYQEDSIFFQNSGLLCRLLDLEESLYDEIHTQKMLGVQSPEYVKRILEELISNCFIYAKQEKIDIKSCFFEVHRSNMSKLGTDGKPVYREDGKILKGPNFTPANLAPFLKEDSTK